MKHLLPALLLAGLFVSCTDKEIIEVAPEVLQNDEATAGDYGVYEAGKVYVYFSEDMADIVESSTASGSVMTRSDALNSAFSSIGVRQIRRLFPYAGEFEERTRAEGLHRWYVVSCSENIPFTRASVDLGDIDGVELVEPVRQIKINDFNDLTSDLWGLWNQSNPGFDVNVKPVWKDYTTGSSDVIVSVVDNGVDTSHEDLSANCLVSGHYNAVDDNSVIVAGNHGTHVAGTIAAVGNNGKGVVGVAGGDYAAGRKGVSIMSCQIFKETSDGTVSGNSPAAIKWGADNGAVISQNSWGYIYDFDGDGKFSTEELEKANSAKVSAADKAAIDYFIKYAGCDNNGNQLPGSPMKGGVVIFAAGNDALANGAPANYSEVIAVGSIASDGTKSTFSNYGDWVDICAPGSSILSTLPGNAYGTMSGTSMACPHVSGVAALIVSHFGGPGFTNKMLKEKLLESSNKSDISQAYQIGGLVDAYGAFVYGNDKAPSAINDLTVSGRGNNIDLNLTVPSDEDGKAAYGFLVIYGNDRQSVEDASENSLNNVMYRTFAPETSTGENLTLTLDELEFLQTYYVKVMAYSYGRSYSEATAVATVSTTENMAPEVKTAHEGDIHLLPSETVNISITAVDPDGHSITVKHVKGSDAETLTQLPDGTWRLSIVGKNADMGTYTAEIQAVDKYGLTGSLSMTYTIKENAAPIKLMDPENVFMKAKGEELTVDMTQYVTDPDMESLKYEVALSNAKVAHVNVKGNNLIITSLAYGSTDVIVTAKDARGEKIETSFKILVKDPSKPLSVYPNPVTDYVNVSTMDMADTDVMIVSQTGKTVYDETLKASAFEPARIDMSSYAPGVYTMTVAFGGKEYEQTVVKL